MDQTPCHMPKVCAFIRAMKKTMLIFGLGYSARALSKHLLAQGWDVIGTTRSAEKADRLSALGIDPIVFPGEDPSEALSRATHLLISAGPDADGDPVLNQIPDLIGAAAGHLEWAGYLSTIGVYGDHQGGWVDETSALTPATKRGEARVVAEAAWQDVAKETGLPLHIFRIAGIYGPGRGPFVKLRKGVARRLIKPGQVFSRIHVEDIAQVLMASIARPNPGGIYNLCDDNPAPPQDVIGYAATLLGMEQPPEVNWQDADLTPMARSFYAESKRVHNDRIKDELGVRLLYPGYQDGLKAVLEAEAD